MLAISATELGSTGAAEISVFQALSAGNGRAPCRLAPTPRSAPAIDPAWPAGAAGPEPDGAPGVDAPAGESPPPPPPHPARADAVAAMHIQRNIRRHVRAARPGGASPRRLLGAFRSGSIRPA